MTMRERVEALEQEMQAMPQSHCPVRHYLAGGLYAREMTIPAGVVLTGAVHRHEHLCTISQGRVIVSTDDGMKELSAPCTIISKPGAKRVGYALETTVWTTYHYIGEETDLDRITEGIVESTRAQLMGGAQNVQANNNLIQQDREDYLKFLDEYELTQDAVTALVEYQGDRVPMPLEYGSVVTGPSRVHGIGMFATRDISIGSPIAPARVGDSRTPAGYSINHSCRANSVFVPTQGGGLMVTALRDIVAGDEITVDYRQAMSANGAGFAPKERITK